MTRAERERRRYRVVVNATGDVKLARQLRARSDQFIYENYGIKVTKTIPKIREVSKETRYKKQLQARKVRYAIERGVPVEQAIKLKKTSFNEIEKRARYYTPVNPPKSVRISKPESTRKDRIEHWREWSKKENKEGFPMFIKRQAERINLKMGFDVNAKYGYTVMFYSYIEKESISKWLKLIQADKVTEMAVYKTPMILV